MAFFMGLWHCYETTHYIPSGKRLHSELENHNFSRVNQRTKWSFSIANC